MLWRQHLLSSRSWINILLLTGGDISRQRCSFAASTAYSLDPIRRRPSVSSSARQSSSSAETVGDESKFSLEIQTGLEAVRKACRITSRLQSRLNEVKSLTKQDASPVTVADFASQAIVLQHLNRTFPSDFYLAEESSEELSTEVLRLIQEATEIENETLLKECIDLGRTFFHNDNKQRFWCLDPIDGTKGFLRNEQYCVALGLLEEGVPTIGILACPNLPMDDQGEVVGCIFVASKGQGCYQLPLFPEETKTKFPTTRIAGEALTSKAEDNPELARFCVGVEQGFADPVGKCKEMAQYLHGGLDEEGEIRHCIRMDSQAKYGVVARGDAEFYVRLPREDHKEWIWDVAPGVLLLEEAGGVVTDNKGRPLDFSQGAKLTSSGVLGAITPKLHQALFTAFQQS